MEILRIILTVIFIVMCIALTVLVLMQEGKDAGLGASTLSHCGGAEDVAYATRRRRRIRQKPDSI